MIKFSLWLYIILAGGGGGGGGLKKIWCPTTKGIPNEWQD